jgi:hypothetical protein
MHPFYHAIFLTWMIPTENIQRRVFVALAARRTYHPGTKRRGTQRFFPAAAHMNIVVKMLLQEGYSRGRQRLTLP